MNARMKPSMRPQAATSQGLARYVLDVAPDAAVQVIAHCASDGSDHWQDFFAHGASDIIAAEPKLGRAFFRGLWSDDGPAAHAAPILAGFLEGLNTSSLRHFLGADALADKNHPAGHIFHGASFETPNGLRYLQMLDHLVQAGLRDDVLFEFVEKFHRRGDLVRATLAGHEDFVRLVVSNLDELPLKYLRDIVQHETGGPGAIALLVDQCGVRLPLLLAPDVLHRSSQRSFEYLNARRARAWPLTNFK